MIVASYFAFLLASHFGALQIFRLTTYHRYFFRALPLLIAFSILLAYLMCVLRLEAFFIWHLPLAFGLLVWVWRKQAAQANAIMFLVEDDAEQRAFLELSMSNTRAYYWLSTVTYLLAFAVAFIAIFNWRLGGMR